jgi:hypothetical protein
MCSLRITPGSRANRTLAGLQSARSQCPVRACWNYRWAHPGRQQGRRFPSLRLEQPHSIRRLLVSAFLADSIQHIHSLRASGGRMTGKQETGRACAKSGPMYGWPTARTQVVNAYGVGEDLPVQCSSPRWQHVNSLNRFEWRGNAGPAQVSRGVLLLESVP